jgi:tRNA pseudouridine32 synthase/23S rRNA pseudouridine746 synthase
MLAYFDPQPARGELPARLPSPFAAAPHPLARRAADELVAALADRPPDPTGGKMFGVLVVEDAAGRLGYLRAFSGMLHGGWDAPGFVPPAFDAAARAAFWPAGEAALGVLAARIAALEAEAAPPREELAVLDARIAAEAAALRERHAANRAARHAAREAGAEAAARAALDRASRADGAEQRAQRAAHRAEREPVAARVAVAEAALAAVEHERAELSRGLLERLQDTYELADARGVRRSLRALFAPAPPPGGAGDCAAPKLLAHAYREGLRPIAFAELWWGPPPLAGVRHAGRFYPACRGKCGPILAHMLGGLDAEPPPVFGADGVSVVAADPVVAATTSPDSLRIIYEDAWLVVADKPAGLLTVPGRARELADCLLARLRARYPEHPDLLVAHRLDLDTSGLVVAAKDRATHAALQRLFASRRIDKRYDAVIEGAPPGDHGVVDLPLRVDLDDRPRQIHDPVHGKPAVTEWRVVARLAGGRTRVALVPHTGRTHQLRVHAAHPLGLDAPIAGDRLYGRAPASAGIGADPGPLLLRAVSLAFEHPATGRAIHLTA